MSLYRTIGESYEDISGQETHQGGMYSDWDRDWLQYQMGEHAADNADARTRALYNELYSAQAQMEQLKAAGLSPSIFASGGIAGKSGVSGAIGSRSSSSQGGSQMLTNMFSAIAQATQVAANVSKTKAETELIKSQTANLEQDTENKGVQKDLITAQIYETLQNTEYKEMATKALEVQKGIDEYTLKIAQFKWDEGISQELIESEARRLYNTSLITEEQWKLIQNEVEYNQATLDTRINLVSAQYNNIIQDTLLKTAQINLTNTQAEKLTNDILLGWYNYEVYRLSQKAQIKWMGDTLKYNLTNLGIQANTSMLNSVTSTINSCIGALGNIVGMSMISAKPNKEVITETEVDGQGKLTTRSRTKTTGY